MVCLLLSYSAPDAYTSRGISSNFKISGTISDSLRNLIMGHTPGSDTFQRHYLNRNVCADLWAIHRAQQPQTELLKQATSHGASKNADRPISLTPEQLESVKSNPLYVQISDTLRGIPKGAKGRRELANRRKQILARLRTKKLNEVREEWDQTQAVEDIEQQAQGKGFTPASKIRASALIPIHPLQQAMLDALNAPLISDLQAQYQRRTNAIKALMAYCVVEERQSTKVLEARRPPPPPERKLQDPLQRARQLRSSVLGPVGKVNRCFFCVAKALTMPPVDPNIHELTRNFSGHPSLSRHFISHHLNQEDLVDKQILCPICVPKVVLYDKMHLQSHAQVVHGIKTSKRTKRQWVKKNN